MKENKKHKENMSDLWGIIPLLKKVIMASFVTNIIIVALFVLYLFHCNEVITTVDATGVYNLVNTETGDIVATDLTPEDITKIMEIINGENKNG